MCTDGCSFVNRRSEKLSFLCEAVVFKKKYNRLGDFFLKELALEDEEGYRNYLRMSDEKFDELLKVQNCINKVIPRVRIQLA